MKKNRHIIIDLKELFLKRKRPVVVNKIAGPMGVKKGKGSYNRKVEKYGWKGYDK